MTRLSEGGCGKGGNGGGAELSHWGDDALHVGAVTELGGGSLSDEGVLAVGVLERARDQGKEAEIGGRDVVSTNVGSSISKSGLKGAQSVRKDSKGSCLGSLVGVVLHHSVALGLLKDVTNSGEEPLGLEDDVGRGGGVPVRESEGLQDSNTLGHVGAVVVDVDGELGADTVGTSFLHGAPDGSTNSLVLIGDVLGFKKVANGLGTALNGEVDELGHCLKV